MPSHEDLPPRRSSRLLESKKDQKTISSLTTEKGASLHKGSAKNEKLTDANKVFCKRRLDFDEPCVPCKKTPTTILCLVAEKGASLHEDMGEVSDAKMSCKRRLDFDEPCVPCKKTRTTIFGLVDEKGASLHEGVGEISGSVKNENNATGLSKSNGNIEDNAIPLLEGIEKGLGEHIDKSLVLRPQTPSPAVKGRILSKRGSKLSKIYPSMSRTRAETKIYAFQASELENSYYYTRSIHRQVVNLIGLSEKLPERKGRMISVWKELMKNNTSECCCTEPKLLYEKVKAFISKVEDFQGRRTFSPWKGSVLDSVVGGFLAQRVNDNQSSSAFMSLGVSFPQCHRFETYSQQDETIRARRSNACSSQKQDVIGSMLMLGNKLKKRFDVKEKDSPGQGKLESRILQKQDQDLEGNDLKLGYEGKKSSTTGKVPRKESKKLSIEHSRIIERSTDPTDYVDWDAVKRANVKDVSKAISVRGMNIKLAKRIKDLLRKLVKDNKNSDLEWLRNAPFDVSMKFLKSIYGYGLKSSSCVQLLTLHQPAFPVDINVARVIVRLGWVPVPPNMSDELQMSMLKEFSSLHELIHEYLWPRLVTIDHKTLYELHCQMITFGKVFCTKKKPKCCECPMKKNCKYFDDNDIEDFGSERTSMKFNNKLLDINDKRQEKEPALLSLDGDSEAPRTPIKEQSLLRLRHKKQPKKSKGRQLNKGKTKTQHTVYELPDGHPILETYNKVVPDDPYPYLLFTWESGHNDLNNSENPAVRCTASSSRSPEQATQTLLGTIFIPCRTALQGKFPLDGTYFQRNEVFADEETTQVPVNVQCETLEQLKRKKLYCGTNISTICKGLSKDEIKSLFNEGYICTRGFNRKTRASVSLDSQFHTSLPLRSKGRRNGADND